MTLIPVTRSISIDSDEIEESATRSGGAGGQHVNTTDSAVILRFDVAQSPNLPDAVKRRLGVLAGSRLTREGVLVLRSEGSRSQHLNRQEVRDRLIAHDPGGDDRPQKAPPDAPDQGIADAPGRWQGEARGREGQSWQGAAGLKACSSRATGVARCVARRHLARMYQFDISTGSKADLYRDLLAAIDAVTADERDGVANMANVAALVWQYLPDLNWAGFYRMVGGELVLGPFQGKVACIRIAVGAGVCGAAAASSETQRVDDVHAFPGHIACDAASQSELVVPIVRQGVVIAVLDLDSPIPGRFDAEDAAGCEEIARLIADRVG